jgi:ATP-dependent Clp protease ATP-binding subunit ClpA
MNTPDGMILGKSDFSLDAIHILIITGAMVGGALDAANIQQPAMANANLQNLSATTAEEFDPLSK